MDILRRIKNAMEHEPKFVYKRDFEGPYGSWERQGDTIVFGLETVRTVVEQAKSVHPNAMSASGLSMERLKRDFPYALADLEKADQKD